MRLLLHNIKKYIKSKLIKSKPFEHRWSLSLAGITFENEDGTKRQDIIKELKDNDPLKLEKYTYNGEDAIRVLTENNQCIGNIKANDVKHVLPLLESVTKCKIFDIHSFLGDSGEKIYIAKVIMYFMQ